MQVSSAMAYQPLNQQINQQDVSSTTPSNMAAVQAPQHLESKLDSTQDTVTISALARQLSEQDKASAQLAENQPMNRPVPEDVLDKLKAYKKAQLEYQVSSDMVSIATGNHNGLSPASIYYLSQHDDARSAVVNASMQQHQVSAMQTYAKSHEQAMSWYQE